MSLLALLEDGDSALDCHVNIHETYQYLAAFSKLPGAGESVATLECRSQQLEIEASCEGGSVSIRCPGLVSHDGALAVPFQALLTSLRAFELSAELRIQADELGRLTVSQQGTSLSTAAVVQASRSVQARRSPSSGVSIDTRGIADVFGLAQQYLNHFPASRAPERELAGRQRIEVRTGGDGFELVVLDPYMAIQIRRTVSFPSVEPAQVVINRYALACLASVDLPAVAQLTTRPRLKIWGEQFSLEVTPVQDRPADLSVLERFASASSCVVDAADLRRALISQAALNRWRPRDSISVQAGRMAIQGEDERFSALASVRVRGDDIRMFRLPAGHLSFVASIAEGDLTFASDDSSGLLRIRAGGEHPFDIYCAIGAGE